MPIDGGPIVSHGGSFKSAEQMFLSVGGVWEEIIIGGNPPASANLTRLDIGNSEPYGPAESMLPALPIPAATYSDVFTFGARFTTMGAGRITHWRYWAQDITATRTLSLWNDAGEKVATSVLHLATAVGWQTVPLMTPLDVAAGATFVTSYSAVPGPWAYGYTDGTAPAVSTAPHLTDLHMIYAATPDTFPASDGANQVYFIDVVFQPAAAIYDIAVLWYNPIIPMPPPEIWEVSVGATTNPRALPGEDSWVIVTEVPYRTSLEEYIWQGANPVAGPGLYTYARVISVGADGGRGSPSYTNPILADPLPGAPGALVGFWTAPATNALVWDHPLELDAATEYVIHYSTVGPITTEGGGTFLATVPVIPRPAAEGGAYQHTKDAGLEYAEHWYAVFARRADGLVGPQATISVAQGVVPAPNLVSTSDTPNSVQLTWTDPAFLGDATGYKLIFRADTWPTGPDDPAATVLLTGAPLTTHNYSHGGLAASTPYYYLLVLHTATAPFYSLSDSDSQTTLAVPPPIPDAPGGVSCVGGILWCWFFVSWNSPGNTAEITSYDMHCAANGDPGAGGTFVRTTMHTAGVTAYLRTLQLRFVSAQTMGASVNAGNRSGEGPFAGAVGSLGGFAWSMCTARSADWGAAYDPHAGEPSQLPHGYADAYTRTVGEPIPYLSRGAYDAVWRLLLRPIYGVDETTWWARVAFALEYAVWLEKPSRAGWDRAGAALVKPYATRRTLARVRRELLGIAAARDNDAAMLALAEIHAALEGSAD